VYVDPATARLRILSDSLPMTLAGVPLDLRRLTLLIDRADFIRNPTSCEPLSVVASATSASGLVSPLDRRFQVGGCGELGFRPRVSLALSGRLGRNGHPALHAVLRTRPGEAGLAGLSITLPSGELLDIRRIRALCDQDLPPESCPGDSRVGEVRLWSPLLEDPLEGAVYLRRPTHRLPDLVADLRAEQVRIRLRGHTAAPAGRLRIRFPALPDVPLTKAVVTLAGGGKGIFVNSEALCAAPRRGAAVLDAHSGKQLLLSPRVRVRGGC
jgi:hypothetical protein